MTTTDATTTDAPLAPLAVAGRLGDDDRRLPLAAVDIDTVIRGLVATTTVRQTFRNNRTAGIEATYVFPLPDRAGVTAFRADLAGRCVEGELRERGDARAEYDAGIAAGHRAAIAEEERSGTFTTRVGNLQPGEDAVITLILTGPLAVDDGVAEYRFPLVVAPRYVAGWPADGPPAGLGTAADTGAVPDASRVTPPVLLPGLTSPVRLSLRARVAGLGLSPDTVRSSLHAVTRRADGDGAVEVSLYPGERLDRDVVLRFPVAGAATRTIAAVAPDEEDPATGTWQVTVVPPRAEPGPASRARDVIVVLDRSGSMHGWKIAAARRAAARIVDSLGTRDRFAVLAFDNVVQSPPGLDTLVPASDRNRWAAVAWLADVEARGGTEMREPLRAAAALLADPDPAGPPAAGAGRDLAADRFLVLVTDGQVAGEDQILAAVTPVAGRTRIFALGIDQAVNAGFLRRLAALGAGRCELVESEDRLDHVMTGLHRRISPPLATGLRVEAAGAELIPDETAPARNPDLHPGGPCTLSGRWRAAAPPAELTLTVRGDGGGPEGLREQVVAAAAADQAVRTCWARARVRDLEDRYAAGDAGPGLADQIVAVSLGHRVLSRFTAFVAVDRSRRGGFGAPQPVLQPVELPRGWTQAGGMQAGWVAGSAVPLLAGRAQAAAGPASPRARRARRGMTLPSHAPAAGPAVTAPGAAPGPFPPAGPVPAAAYLARAEELFARIQQDLDRGRGLDDAAAAADELAGDLDSVGSPGELVEALWRLAAALRGSGDPRAALAAARRAFAGEERPTARAPGPASRRAWWR
jgi:Ca-activated chloride channel homolog